MAAKSCLAAVANDKKSWFPSLVLVMLDFFRLIPEIALFQPTYLSLTVHSCSSSLLFVSRACVYFCSHRHSQGLVSAWIFCLIFKPYTKHLRQFSPPWQQTAKKKRKMSASLLFGLSILAASVTPVLSSCAYGTHLMPRAEGGEVKVGKFGYAGAIVS